MNMDYELIEIAKKYILDGLDEDQKAAVCKLDNVVVAAGAGSGKTRVLTQRFAYLAFCCGIDVDKILTLTFTKKAAAEMYSRIYSTIDSFTATTIPEKLRNRALSMRENFFKASIQTLDSYCSSVFRPSSHHYGISPDYSIDEDVLADVATDLAVPFMLKYKDNKALLALTQASSPENIAQQLFVKPILKYSSIINPIDFENSKKKQLSEVASLWDKIINELESLVSILLSYYSNSQRSADNPPEKPFFPEINETIIDEKSFNPTEIIDIVLYYSYFASLRSSKTIKEVLEQIRILYGKLTGLAHFIMQFDIIKEVFPLLQDFENQFIDYRRSSGILSYRDISDLALRSLIDYPDIRNIEKQKYSAIMIDEFQDNNSMQRDLLFLLAENLSRCEKSLPQPSDLESAKLFFVGDEKQSIYRFRGADVSVFRELSTDLATNNESAMLYLSTNYRSSKNLVDAFNFIFGGLLPEDDGIHHASVFSYGNDLPAFEASYNRVLSDPKKESENDKNKPAVTIYSLPDKKNLPSDDNVDFLTDDELEAFYVAKKIRELIDGSDTDSPLAPENIAILLRKYSHQGLFEKQLRFFGVPYVSENFKDFFSDGPINDIYNFLRLCIYPEDNAAYAAFLKSPFVCLSEQSMQSILSVHKKGDDLFADDKKQLLKDHELLRFDDASRIYKKIIEDSITLPICKILTLIWYEVGYRYETLWNKSVQSYTELYDILFEYGRRFDETGKNLSCFVDKLHDINSSWKDDKLDSFEIPLERSGAVHIMSIHKSKGLQFDTVFICRSDSDYKQYNDDCKVYFNKNWGVSIKLPLIKEFGKNKYIKENYFSFIGKDDEDQQNIAELRRLLYVGMTRAEKHIYITGYSTTDGVRQTFAQLLLPVFEQENVNISDDFVFDELKAIKRTDVYSIAFSSHKKYESNKKTEYLSKTDFIKTFSPLYQDTECLADYNKSTDNLFYRTPSHFDYSAQEILSVDMDKSRKNDSLPQLRTIIENSLPKNKDGSLNYSAEPKFSYASFGTMAHNYLECAVNNVLPDIPLKIIDSISKTELKVLEEICQNMADVFINSPIGKEVLAASLKKTECPFKLIIKGNDGNRYILNGTADLVFKNNDGDIIIVDYKTNQEENPSIYAAQLAAYRRSFAKIFSVPESCVKCFLYYLRSGNCIEITNLTEQVILEDLICKSNE